MSKLMEFNVDEHALKCQLLKTEIQGRMFLKKNPSKREELIRGKVINSPSITKFMKKHPEFFGNKKLICGRENFLDGMIHLSPIAQSEKYVNALKTRLEYEYDFSEEEVEQIELDNFIKDFEELGNSSDIRQKISDTESYKNSIERAWKLNETQIMSHVKDVLGYEPQNVGKVYTYIVYPNSNIQRCYEPQKGKIFSYFAKKGETDPCKILSYLTHQAVHQPMLPYKPTMTKEEKEKFHCFIKFLADKDTYNFLSGKSYLDIVTKGENSELMAKIYPFWLGYRYRNVDKEGLDPSTEIAEAIKRDKEYFDSLPQDSKRRKLYDLYEFDKLDPEKIALLFREKRGITPYEFSKLDFDRNDLVYKPIFQRIIPEGIKISKSQNNEHTENVGEEK